MILRAEIETLGHAGDVVEVAPGYARNYLVPRGLAYVATEANKHRVSQEKKKYEEQLAAESTDPETASSARAHAGALRGALVRAREAVEASGLKHHELWSYRVGDGGVEPIRYGTSTDVQLWNVTDLAVQYALARLTGQ